ncbi:MAG TPA: hypothetical protein VKU02_15525, partial [Gemmataceae bacterium]|nr:hypothetical protein [Gemmataceae bacterium]
MWPTNLRHRGSPVVSRRQPSRRRFRPLLELLESRLVLMGLTGPPPVINNISASLSGTGAVPEGSPSFTLTVNGSNFVQGAVIDWNGMDLATNFVSSSQLTASVPAQLVHEESTPDHGGPISITVVEFNVPSNAVPFTVTEAPILAKGAFTFSGPSLTNVTVATFTDTGGPEFPFDYSALINWGDGTTSSGTISGPDQNGVFSVISSHTYNTLNPYMISVTITHETAPPVTVTDFVNTMSPTGGFVITGVEGQPLNNVIVATFTSPTPNIQAGNFSASINWGDGTTSPGTITGPDQNGVFTVTGSHTYKEEGNPFHGGPFIVTVMIMQNGGFPITVTDTSNIAEAPLAATGGFILAGVQGQPITNAVVATFIDTGGPENPLDPGDYTATINWGDGSSSPGTISGPDQNGVFTVSGGHSYASQGTFTITTTIVHESAPPVTATSTAVIAAVSPTGGFTLTGVEGQPLNNVIVATFTAAGNHQASDFSATINWGDGTSSAGTIVGPNGNGVFTVLGSHTYTEESKSVHGAPFTITVTISDGAPPSVTTTSTANIAEAPLAATGGFSINGMEGQLLNNVAVATFIDTGGPENPLDPGDYSATISWGDGSSSTGTIKGPDQNGVFTVCGSHTYAEDGEGEQDLVDAFPITVTITHELAPPVTVTSTAHISEEAEIVSAQGGFVITGKELQPLNNVVVAVFTGDGGETAKAFKATINWGDGTSSAGTITGPDQNGVFTVLGSHTYAEEGEVEQDQVDVFPLTITISDGTSVTVTSTANIAEEADIVSAQGGFVINGRELKPLTNVVVATFSGDGDENVSQFKATINWGDGTSSAGTIAGPDQNGVFTVLGSHTYAEEGEIEQDQVDVFPLTITISDGVSATVTSAANIAEEADIISAQGGFVINGRELQPLTNVVVATFSGDGDEAASQFTATINWGDGTSSAGTIKGPDQNGVFTVCGTHTYAEDGENEVDLVDPFTVTVTISNSTTVTVTSTANIAEEAEIVSAQGGFVANGVEGQPLTNVVVATFTSDGGETASAFHATINWGDGTSSAGTIKGPDKNGLFTVCGTHTYTEEGNSFHGGPPTITVTITDGTSITVTSTANIAEAPLAATGGFSITGMQFQQINNVVVATFIDTGGPENASDPGDYTATIKWGDGTATAGAISGPDLNGVFTVAGSHVYGGQGTFTITVTIKHESAAPVTVTSTAAIPDPPPGGMIVATGQPVKAIQSVNQNQTVAQFLYMNPGSPSGTFTATITWGDGPNVDKG